MSATQLAEGQPAPDFTAETQDGNTISLADFRGKWVVLYFYPKDDTPGCTREACSLRDTMPTLVDMKAVVLGVSRDAPASHRKFIAKFGLPFTLIADTDAAVSTRYGVYQEKTLYGRIGLGIQRTTFLIDPAGIIRRIFAQVKVDTHGEDVLAAIRELSGS